VYLLVANIWYQTRSILVLFARIRPFDFLLHVLLDRVGECDSSWPAVSQNIAVGFVRIRCSVCRLGGNGFGRVRTGSSSLIRSCAL
jgi:hypothetical protein